MSANQFTRLLEEFQSEWIAIDGRPFVLEFVAPTDPVDPSFGWQGRTYEYVGTACLPLDEAGNWVDSWAIINSEIDIAGSIDRFRELCKAAGAYLPAVIRDRVGEYYMSFSDTDTASWWTALLARYLRIHGNNIHDSLTRPKVFDPLHVSTDIIEKLRLNTDSPGWPEDKKDEAGATRSRQTSPSGKMPFVPTPLQVAILKALNGRALKKDPLAGEVCGGDDSRLYKAGGLKELRDLGMVDHKHGVGYFRPDALPPTSL